jgi:hypothetical protein
MSLLTVAVARWSMHTLPYRLNRNSTGACPRPHCHVAGSGELVLNLMPVSFDSCSSLASVYSIRESTDQIKQNRVLGLTGRS